jgi:hypothetical protein
MPMSYVFRDRNWVIWEVQAGSPDKIFVNRKCLYG